jgi:hypothetical protein
VITVTAEPMTKSATRLRAMLVQTAVEPLRKKEANTGTIALTEKSRKDVIAAVPADPPSSSRQRIERRVPIGNNVLSRDLRQL